MNTTASLHAIAYVSSATNPMNSGDLDRLLAASRRNNLLENVTGLLLYCEGNFIQYIEGDEHAVKRVYQLIRSSRLHHDIIELLSQTVAAREFGQWSMAYSRPQLREFLAISKADWRKPATGAASGLELLLNLWHAQNPYEV